MRKYKLICFDVDGTLIDNVEYSWQLFHDYFQTDKHRREDAKRKFYSGKITYLEWAEHDINLWREVNATKKDFYKAIELANVKLMEGALETINVLKKNKFKLAIISGSVNVILDKLFPEHNDFFDYVFLSKIFFDDGGVISGVNATEFDMLKKVDALKQIVSKEDISLKECVFIGDHDNDAKIAEEAGLGIAFNCKSDKLREVADVVIEKKDLREVLRYVL